MLLFAKLQVLRLDNNNEKAFFRKGCALMKALKYDPAIECFKNCPKSTSPLATILTQTFSFRCPGREAHSGV